MTPDEFDTGPTEWTAHADRLAPLVDGVEYFRHLRDGLIQAQRQVMIVGWEIHSEIELVRGDQIENIDNAERWPHRLSDLLRALVDARPELFIRLLIWEGQSLFALERQHFPRMTRPWAKHDRIRLVWDRDTPTLASHHQKLVVIDDALAFAGGMDVTQSRWDTHDHEVEDPLRSNPGIFTGRGFPYHDVMLTMDGAAARTLGDWARERWKRATGETIQAPDPIDGDSPWPPDLNPTFENNNVSMALTQPEYGGRPEKRQIEECFLRQIAQAKRFIFIENQYFACEAIARALCERLREDDGPEVIIILPYGCPGTPQSMGLDPQRDRLLDTLREADTGGRLGVYWATLQGGDTENVYEKSVYVHAKVMVIDDALMRIGSANLNNRSMGVDTELDLIVTAEDSECTAAIARFRRRVTAYLLDVDEGDIVDLEDEDGSPLQAIEELRGGTKTLHPFDHRAGEFQSNYQIPIELADPGQPLSDIDVQTLLDRVLDESGSIETLRTSIDRVIDVLNLRRDV